MSEHQPEYVWAFPPEKPRRGRVWLIVGLAVAAVALAVLVFWLFLRPGAPLQPSPTISPSASATVTPSPSPSATPTASPTATSTPTPIATVTSPPPADPDLPVFRERVDPILRDADTGLGFADEVAGQEGIELVDQLRDDAGRLSDAAAPSSIAREWTTRVDAYARSLDALRLAYEQNRSTASAIGDAQAAVYSLNRLLRG